ncbi:MAG: hypothetical protein SLAVMIC_01027 [uncultured marine phage]|uniref:Uncharacterized protein n=1 Tax=uncultured marine phage TaxID=707152 RepID=A0A8D9C9X3_9VIRU|nr:MAG: hypothetical protein SLAVMIC_01027 [uncultured marine phage]
MVTVNINHDGTIEWRSSRMKELLEDFDATISTRTVTGKAGEHRTEAITIKPTGSTNTLEFMGVNDEIEIDHKNRKHVDIQFLELRGAIDSDDEGILIANAIILDRLKRLGFIVEEKPLFKKRWTGTTTHTHTTPYSANNSVNKPNATVGSSMNSRNKVNTNNRKKKRNHNRKP